MIRKNLQALIMGKVGSGKSTLARALLSYYSLWKKRTYHLSISTKIDHWRPPKFEYEIDLSALGYKHLPIEPKTINQLNFDRVLSSNPKLAITLKGLPKSEIKTFWGKVKNTLLEKGCAVILVDEGDTLIPQHPEMEGAVELIRSGRWKGIDILTITHHEGSIHNDVVENANCYITFALRAKHRLDRLRYTFDPQVVTGLKEWEYACYDEPTNTEFTRLSTKDFAELKKMVPRIFVDGKSK